MEKAIRANGKTFTSFYTRGEEIFNAVSHVVGGGLGICILVTLALFAYPSAAAEFAVSTFALSVVTLYTMSALYHFLPNGRAKGVFRVFDHCTIFLLIAGTYTPYCLLAVGGATGFWLMIAEWILAAVGITGNAIAMNNPVVKGLSMALYFTMGWAALAFLPLMLAQVPLASVLLLLAGGVAYTGGIVFFAFGKRVRYFHSIWHLFDIAGTLLQAAGVLLILL